MTILPPPPPPPPPPHSIHCVLLQYSYGSAAVHSRLFRLPQCSAHQKRGQLPRHWLSWRCLQGEVQSAPLCRKNSAPHPLCNQGPYLLPHRPVELILILVLLDGNIVNVILVYSVHSCVLLKIVGGIRSPKICCKYLPPFMDSSYATLYIPQISVVCSY